MDDIFDWFSGLEFFGIKLGLDQTRAYFALLGNPEKNLKFIHIAGSNGKGSTAAFLESCLRHAGYKTGLYTSPHLAKVNERFILDGIPVSDERLSSVLVKCHVAAEKLLERGMRVTYFETATAAAALLFAENNVDFVIWETGMGGRLDATNIVTPLVSVITTISLEHKEYLGDTVEKIAFEKAGIIKESVPVFTGPSIPEGAMNVIRGKAAEMHAPLTAVKDVPGQTGIVFRDSIPCQKLSNGLEISLAGAHQRANAALAYAVLDLLQKKFHFDREKAESGFPETVWPARFQLFAEEDLLIDGAHNPECAQILANALRECYPGKKFDFIYGNFADKDASDMLRVLIPLASSFIFIPIASSRKSAPPAALEALVRKSGFTGECSGSTLEEALSRKRPPSPEKGPRILCGSLHLCGEYLLMRGGDPFIRRNH